ncbi:MAG: EVE domain-containing protein [Ignavibacteria bacterium]|nr:EVE domain-containing protein [Ignavibacteria bacterium]
MYSNNYTVTHYELLACKSEPTSYSWDDFVKDGETIWSGVRNYQARNNLKLMQNGDLVYYYHSNDGLEIVGIAIVVKEFYQDPTTEDKNWVAVNLKPYLRLQKPVTLRQIKEDERLTNINILRQGRLSVVQIAMEEFFIVLDMAESNDQFKKLLQ